MKRGQIACNKDLSFVLSLVPAMYSYVHIYLDTDIIFTILA